MLCWDKVPGTCLRARVGISDRGVYLSYDLNVGAVLPDFAKQKMFTNKRAREREKGQRWLCACEWQQVSKQVYIHGGLTQH